MFCDIVKGVLTVKCLAGVEEYALRHWEAEGSRIKVEPYFTEGAGTEAVIRSTVGATAKSTPVAVADDDTDERATILTELKKLGVTQIKKGTRLSTLKVMLDNARSSMATSKEETPTEEAKVADAQTEETDADMFGLDDSPAEKPVEAKVKKPATLDDCRSALMAYAKAKSGPEARKLLGNYGVTSVSKLKPEQYGAVIADCEKGL